MLTPFRRFYFSGAFTYSHSRTVTADTGAPATSSVVPYRGDIYTFVGTAAYALNPKTGLQASYSFSCAGYGQNNSPTACRSAWISHVTFYLLGLPGNSPKIFPARCATNFRNTPSPAAAI